MRFHVKPVAFLLLCLSAFVQSASAIDVPAIDIKSADSFKPYTFCTFEAVLPDKWGCDWRFPDAFQKMPIDVNGKKVIAVGPPGTHTVELIAVGPGDDNVPYAIRSTKKTFMITDGVPGPVDPNNPDVVPDGKYGLAKAVIDQLRANNCPKPTAADVAAVFGEVAKKIRDGKYADNQAALDDLKAMNAKLLSKRPDFAAWEKALNAVAAQMNGKVTESDPIAEVATALSEVQTGALYYSSH